MQKDIEQNVNAFREKIQKSIEEGGFNQQDMQKHVMDFVQTFNVKVPFNSAEEFGPDAKNISWNNWNNYSGMNNYNIPGAGSYGNDWAGSEYGNAWSGNNSWGNFKNKAKSKKRDRKMNDAPQVDEQPQVEEQPQVQEEPATKTRKRRAR